MRVELATEVYTAAEPQASEIHAVARLLETFDIGRHDWVVDIDAVDAVADYLRRYQSGLAQGYVPLAEMAAQQNAAWTGTTQGRSWVVIGPDDLVEHSSDLCRPAVVVVENIPGDEHFLTAVIFAFGADRIRKALEEGWLEFRHGGGSGSVPAVAEAEAARFRRSVRVVAVFDSDSIVPGQRTGNHQRADQLAGKRISAYVLLLREAENYAPNNVLAEIGKRAEASRKLTHLKRLLPRQRGHYDMKKGFSDEKPEQRTFFADVDVETRTVLHEGFGKAVLEKMFEMRHELSESHFESLDAELAADLRRLLALIDSKI